MRQFEDHPTAPDEQPGQQIDSLSAAERHTFVQHIAVLAEHVRRLSDQVVHLGATPCVQPPPAQVITTNDPMAAVRHLESELRVANDRMTEEARQKAALRVKVNQLVEELVAARAAAAPKTIAPQPFINVAHKLDVKVVAEPVATTAPDVVTSPPATTSLKSRPQIDKHIVLAFLRGRASSANAKFIAERIGFDLKQPDVDCALDRLRDAGDVVHVDLAGTPTWRAKS